MAFKIFLSPLAKKDIVETADYIRERGNTQRAARWKNELITMLQELTKLPLRCSIADESTEVGFELRESQYRSHRVIFTVDVPTRTVQMLRLYHSARAPLNLEDIE